MWADKVEHPNVKPQNLHQQIPPQQLTWAFTFPEGRLQSSKLMASRMMEQDFSMDDSAPNHQSHLPNSSCVIQNIIKYFVSKCWYRGRTESTFDNFQKFSRENFLLTIIGEFGPPAWH
jgi:hypothetical protein